ncbi:UNVERIFIED_CONTAM: hypothetical protein H355_010606 [Colinus virginianus]|nr:hypothetical protein H355_010606 [Colinus virginianus]
MFLLLFHHSQMLHGKHVMVRVGGGWDTLQGFLLKYDPCRVLQFATLEQKILAFQKGVTSDNVSNSPARIQEPPVMNPMSAVNMFQKQPSNPPTPVPALKTFHGATAKKPLSKCAQSPALTSPKVPVHQSSAAKLLSARPKLTDAKSPFRPLMGTSKKLESPALHLPASAPSLPASKSSSSTRSRTALVHSETLRKRIRSPDAPKQLYVKSENTAQTTGTGSQHPRKTPQTSSNLSRNLKTASILKHSASVPSLAVSKALKSPPALGSASKNAIASVNKTPTTEHLLTQNVTKPPEIGPSSSKPPERTPLSVVRLPQTSAKVAVTKKTVQPSTKSQPSNRDLQVNGNLVPAAKKPLSKGKSATACNKGAPSASKGPLLKSKQDDHYFVMTGSKKPRK